MRRPHKRPRLCKRCAALARQRSFLDSFWNSRVETLDQFLETRLVAQRIKALVHFDASEQALQQDVALRETFFEQTQSFLLFTKRQINDRQRISADISLRGKVG